MGHTEIIGGNGETADKGDRLVWTRSKASQRRVDEWKLSEILSSSAPEQVRLARAQMFALSIGERAARSALSDSARVLLAWVQEELEQLGLGTVLEPGVAFALFADRAWSLRALRDRHTQQETKAIEMQATDCAPLTMCMGRAAFVTTPDVYQVALDSQLAGRFRRTTTGIPIYGCLAIFEESTNVDRGRMWRSWCPACTPRRGQRTRAAGRKHLRRLRGRSARG